MLSVPRILREGGPLHVCNQPLKREVVFDTDSFSFLLMAIKMSGSLYCNSGWVRKSVLKGCHLSYFTVVGNVYFLLFNCPSEKKMVGIASFIVFQNAALT